MRGRAIIVPDGTRFAEVVTQLGDAVVQLMPPRLALVRDAEELTELPKGAFFVDQGEYDLLPGERLFVEASLKRMDDKDRPGDGLPWDAPGRTPPG